MDFSPLTCTAEELFTVVSGHSPTWLLLSLSNPSLSLDHLIALLRNPAVTEEVVRAIAERQDWLSIYKVQFGIVNCPKTPYQLALRILQLLFWNDLLKTALNFRLNPRLRHTAETHLREKMLSMTSGEKKALARTAPRGLITYLRNETDRDVYAAVLQNPRLVEEDLLVTINKETTSSAILELISTDSRWAHRYSIRAALIRNPRTPLRFSLSFLSGLTRQDLLAVAHSPRTHTLIRRTAVRLLNQEY